MYLSFKAGQISPFPSYFLMRDQMWVMSNMIMKINAAGVLFHPFKHLIMITIHAQFGVDLLCICIRPVNI